MISIPRDQWLQDSFAEVLEMQDLIRQPLSEYAGLSDKEKDQLRQTQVFRGEILQLLGRHEGFYLCRKYEQTLGWLPEHILKSDNNLTGFKIPGLKFQASEDFFSTWKGTPYVFGGLSKEGIDCSGFSQLYYMNVLGMILPKNSFDQRKLGIPSDIKNLKENDLIFCRPFHHPDHHVAIFYQGNYWHSRRSGGVVCQTEQEFLNQFNIEEVKTLMNPGSTKIT